MKKQNKSLKSDEGDDVTVLFRKEKSNLRKLFGAHKFSKSVKKLMKEIDKELYTIP